MPTQHRNVKPMTRLDSHYDGDNILGWLFYSGKPMKRIVNDIVDVAQPQNTIHPKIKNDFFVAQ